MTHAFDPRSIADTLARAWNGADRLANGDVPVADASQAYAVQGELIARLGPLAGWKVGFLGSAEAVSAVAEILSDYPDVPLVTYMPNQIGRAHV